MEIYVVVSNALFGSECNLVCAYADKESAIKCCESLKSSNNEYYHTVECVELVDVTGTFYYSVGA